tara:strand:- start:90 stop:434 length:345 start_codon:yes stop_codon:yes gene_type:complete
MIGKLDPEENVMKDIPKHDWTENKDGFFAWEDDGIMDRVQDFIETLGWNSSDNVAVEIGGTQIYEIEGAGTKWAPLKGTRKYNKDAFIVIKNRTRDPYVPSKTIEEQNVNDEVK